MRPAPRIGITVLVTAVLTTSGVTSSASAGEDDLTGTSVESIEIVDDLTELQLEFNEPITYDQAVAAIEDIAPEGEIDLTSNGELIVTTPDDEAAGAAALKPRRQPTTRTTASSLDETDCEDVPPGEECDIDLDPDIDPRPTVAQIYCDTYNSFNDENAIYTIQRGCGRHAAPWSVRLTNDVEAFCAAGTLKEWGMRWWKDDVQMPMNAPHPLGLHCGYTVHGTYNPVAQGNIIRYEDRLTFRHIIGPGGTARLTVYGKFKLRGAG